MWMTMMTMKSAMLSTIQMSTVLRRKSQLDPPPEAQTIKTKPLRRVLFIPILLRAHPVLSEKWTDDAGTLRSENKRAKNATTTIILLIHTYFFGWFARGIQVVCRACQRVWSSRPVLHVWWCPLHMLAQRTNYIIYRISAFIVFHRVGHR